MIKSQKLPQSWILSPLEEKGATTWASFLLKRENWMSWVSRRKNWDRGVAWGKLGLSPVRKEHYLEILPKVAQRSSETADRSEKMEYRVRDMMACKYMSGREGESFTWKISGMIEKWFFVELENTIEGFIEFGFTGYHFNSEIHAIINNSTQKKLHFWDEVQVALKSVDMSRYRLDFELS